MKKIYTMLVLSFLICATAFAQRGRNITGTVVSEADNSPVIGATVLIEGTDNGAISDHNGHFTINNVKGEISLEASMLGFETTIVPVAPSATAVDITMNSTSLAVDDVVVTGLGISRAKKALGYAVQEVDGAELTEARTSNVVGALSGRVAGVQITTSTGQIGGGAKINIRGNTSLTGNNQPLFVVDGVPISNADFSMSSTGSESTVAGGSGGYDMGNLAGDLNSDDIETMTVLKGASATAIYGSRGANGVVLITTKKSKMGKKSFGVSVNSQVTIEKVGTMPVAQKEYGAGYGDSFETATIGGKTYNLVDYAMDESWGPKYDANTYVLQWNAFDQEADPDNYLKETAWMYPENDYKSYFETGVGTTNNIQIEGSEENYSYRLSYTNLKQTGTTPNSDMLRHTVSFSGNAKINKITDSWVAVNYVENKVNGRPENGYGDRSLSKLWQWTQTSLDYDDLKNYKSTDGSQRTWNRSSWDNASPVYTDNPYWSAYENYQNDRRDRVYGNTGINITPMTGMKITARAGFDTYNFTNEERMSDGSATQSEYVLQNRWGMETNFDLFGTYNTRFNDDKWGVSAMIGASSNDRKSSLSGGYTSGGLVIPSLYNLNNSVSKATVYDSKYQRRTNSIYANATLDFNQLIYLDVTARNDWSSTLSIDNCSYFYPSANLSIVLTELDALKNISWLSFAKLRGGWAQVGNDTDEYSLSNYYYSSTSYNGNPMYYASTTINNSELLPEKTNSWEIGLEAQFLNNRLGFDVAYYEKRTLNQIVPISTSYSSGYSAMYVNAGEMSNKGYEITINATPIRSQSGFTWDLQLNLATLKSKVVELTDDITFLELGSSPFGTAVTGAYVGMSYPTIYGTNYVFDEDGNKMVDPSTGLYEVGDTEAIGDVTPDFTAGLSTSFSYKGFDLSILFDMQMGGNMFYTSQMWGMYAGVLEETAQASNVPGATGTIREDGIILEGVNSATGEVNTTVADGESWAASYYSGVAAQNVYKTDYLKLREIRLGYTFPAAWTGPIKSLRLSFFGRNLATWMTDNQHFDPEYMQMSGSNIQGLEGGYIPTTKTFGFGLSFNF